MPWSCAAIECINPQVMKFPESPRLTYHSWSAEDLDDLHRLNADVTTMAYFPGVQNRAQAKELLEKLKTHFDLHQFTYFLVREKVSQDFMGFIGCKWQNYEHPSCPHIDIGWRLMPKYWGKGFASEGAKACLRFVFENFEAEEIYAVAPNINLASIGVMKKIGMNYQETFEHPLLKDYPRIRACDLYKIKK